jgi:RNA polymerase sigma-70 factor
LDYLQRLCRAALRYATSQLRATVDEEEVTTTVLSDLVIKEPGGEPKLAQYSGRCQLHGWLQVIMAHNVMRATWRHRRSEQLHEAMLTEAGWADLGKWRGNDPATKAKFKQALLKALDGLSDRDRALLRLRLDGLSMASMASLYNVRQATISRWLEKVNVLVEYVVRQELSDSLGLNSKEIDSLVRSVLSQVGSSIRYLVAGLGRSEKP